MADRRANHERRVARLSYFVKILRTILTTKIESRVFQLNLLAVRLSRPRKSTGALMHYDPHTSSKQQQVIRTFSPLKRLPWFISPKTQNAPYSRLFGIILNVKKKKYKYKPHALNEYKNHATAASNGVITVINTVVRW